MKNKGSGFLFHRPVPIYQSFFCFYPCLALRLRYTATPAIATPAIMQSSIYNDRLFSSPVLGLVLLVVEVVVTDIGAGCTGTFTFSVKSA
jgi:hypothetical protein